MKSVFPDAPGLATAVAALRAGEVVAHPTETVYGLAADPLSETALDALFAVKGREAYKSVLLIVDSAQRAASLTTNLSESALRCMESFWPGPLSLVLPGVPGLPDRIVGDGGTVCVRCPGCGAARDLCRLWGGALTSTSANRAGAPPAVSASDAALPGVSVVIDGGILGKQPPSTLFDPVLKRVLRSGPITEAMLKAVGVL